MQSRVKEPKTISLRNVGWICRTCWSTGLSSVRAIAINQHADLAKQAPSHVGVYVPLTSDHEPDLVMRDEMGRVEFEAFIGQPQPLNLDAGDPIQVK